MRLLDQLVVAHKTGDRYIQLFQGDLTRMPDEHEVDVLVVSAMPNSYGPYRGTLIADLEQRGVSVEKLAEHKEVDLRYNFSCWMSKEIQSPKPGIAFKRILCFEPLFKGEPVEVIGDIFLSLTSFVVGDPTITRIAIPLVGAGMQGASPVRVLDALVDAAVHWMELGLPVTHLKIVERSDTKAALLKDAFAFVKERYVKPVIQPHKQFKYDLFISYSQENTDEAMFLLKELQRRRPTLRIFIDRYELNPGSAWQQEIFEALDNCHKVIALYSPSYLSSKVCKEEFSIGLFRHQESEGGTLIPIYLRSANLPTYMKLIQYIDCREADQEKLSNACETILAALK